MDTGKYVHLHTPKETESLNAKSSEQLGAAPPKPESEIITTLRGEVENIQDGIRSLMMARSYLLRRIEEGEAQCLKRTTQWSFMKLGRLAT
jgi:hypothetical protein